MLILGLKGLRFENTPRVEGSGFSHRVYGYMRYIYTPQLSSSRERLETKSCCHVMYSNQTKCKCCFFKVQMPLATLATCTYTVFIRISAHLG